MEEGLEFQDGVQSDDLRSVDADEVFRIQALQKTVQRAAAVEDFLTGSQIPEAYRLNGVRFVLSSAADREPINPRGINSDEARNNRRVEIIVTERVVEDWQGSEGPPAF